MRLPFAQVDVFTNRAFLGNPVAVVLNAESLSPQQMQQIARWTNLSETTFVLPAQHEEADYRLRIFDPSAEMPFAGHPTLGSAFAVLRSGIRPRHAGVLIQECGVGLVPIHVDVSSGTLAFEAPRAHFLSCRDEDRTPIAAALQIMPHDLLEIRIIQVGPVWITARMRSAEQVLALTPDYAALTALSQRWRVEGVTVFGPHPATSELRYEVRSFAPATGVPEDPVCGSGNACVASMLQLRGENFPYIAGQGQRLGRDGRIHVSFSNGVVSVGGAAVLCIEGTLLCPES